MQDENHLEVEIMKLLQYFEMLKILQWNQIE